MRVHTLQPGLVCPEQVFEPRYQGVASQQSSRTLCVLFVDTLQSECKWEVLSHMRVTLKFQTQMYKNRNPQTMWSVRLIETAFAWCTPTCWCCIRNCCFVTDKFDPLVHQVKWKLWIFVSVTRKRTSIWTEMWHFYNYTNTEINCSSSNIHVLSIKGVIAFVKSKSTFIYHINWMRFDLKVLRTHEISGLVGEQCGTRLHEFGLFLQYPWELSSGYVETKKKNTTKCDCSNAWCTESQCSKPIWHWVKRLKSTVLKGLLWCNA